VLSSGLAGVDPLVKRLLDVAGSLAGLVLLAPLLLVVWALVRATSPGPALFRQTRVGAGGRSFSMLKFRSMYRDSDETPHREYILRLMHGQVDAADGLYKLSGDLRVTRVGAVLRRLSLDELPQLVNVLRGDMSLVGPRPVLPWEVELLPAWAAPRFSVRPGITGLWQVSGRNRLTMLEAVAIDVEYVRTRSCWLDLWILARTVPAVLGRGGR
jgi:lipopolysaccharide/colanic/teichoic acid biosynthesis glycosyltransferase